MPVTEENIAGVFPFYVPDESQRLAYLSIREAALAMARAILEFTPKCADQQAAIRQLRESVHTAYDAITLRGAI